MAVLGTEPSILAFLFKWQTSEAAQLEAVDSVLQGMTIVLADSTD